MQVWCTSCLKPPKVVLQEVLQKVVCLVAHILGQLFSFCATFMSGDAQYQTHQDESITETYCLAC